MLTVGSLFSGIGVFDLGLERAGMRVVWQVEQNEYAREVLRKHWPEVPCYGDVKRLHFWGLNREHLTGDEYCSQVDVLAGGFPCQDISVAGKGKGIKEGTRSGLWSEFARLVRDLSPRYVVVENVPALRSRGLSRVLGDLAACGYDAEWDCFPASAFGAPHRRDRLFIVAYPKREFVWLEPGRSSGTHRPDTVFPSGDGFAGDVADSPSPRPLPGAFEGIHRKQDPTRPRDGKSERRGFGEPSEMADSQRGRHPSNLAEGPAGQEEPGATERRGESVRDIPNADRQGLAVRCEQSAREELEALERSYSQTDAESAQPGLGRGFDGIPSWLDGSWEYGIPRIAHGVPKRVDRLRCLGNAVVPAVAEYVGRLIVAHAARAAKS